ncbi:MAG TPA: NADH-quinone oxidoreductase subunit NuoG [Anaerolineales bacterium]|nr:NADH-quinone oxidoreductase subunit NuoG [Anaerolineales bacterium]
MATIYIDGKEYEVDSNKNLLHVGLSLGLDIPYFCWHPAMGSVGACRQCAVKQYKDENDQQGKIVMACMTPAADGTRISIHDPEAVHFRATVIEWLMVNHPHDCPICDEGGECHLQDMTVMTGHDYRRFRFKKRTYRNQYLGPFVNHEMNRCIQCYRCVRFYRDFAGGDDLDVFRAHDQVYFGRQADGVLESEFSGNLVEVCPTGVFTDKTLKEHYTRKWDLTTAPSVCVHCGLGCNTIPGERYGELRRVRNRYNRQVNGYFLCDRGRYGYEFVNSARRIREPFARKDGSQQLKAVAVGEAQSILKDILANSSGLVGIGSPRASLESNFALRTLVGPDRFFAGVSDQEHQLLVTALRILREGPARSASLHDVEQSDAVLVLGEDLNNTAPMMAYALRQSVRHQPMHILGKMQIPDWNDAAIREAVQDETGPLYLATSTGTRLDQIAAKTYHASPEDLARLGFAVAHALDTTAAPVPDLSDELRTLAEDIAGALKAAERPLVISGISSGSEALLQAAANVAWALSGLKKPVGISFVVPEPNDFGLGLVDCGTLSDASERLEKGEADTLVILENDLYRRADSSLVDRLLGVAKHVIAIDHLENRTTDKAEVVLPAATFAEGDGTFVNNEGRAQRFLQVFVPQGDVQESWRWLRDMINLAGREEARQWAILDDITAALAAEIALFAPVPEITPRADFRIAGEKIPRAPHRYSGRTAMNANVNVSEPKPPQDPDTAMSFTMEGFKGIPPAPLAARYWAPGWNSVQALNKFQSEVAGPLKGGDPGKRLIEPSAPENVSYYEQIPQAFQPREGEWRILPLFHIFGSEELSVHTPGIVELAPIPYLALNRSDAESLHLKEGDIAELTLGQISQNLPLKLLESLPSGVAGLPVGLAGMPALALPDWGHVGPGTSEESEE